MSADIDIGNINNNNENVSDTAVWIWQQSDYKWTARYIG